MRADGARHGQTSLVRRWRLVRILFLGLLLTLLAVAPQAGPALASVEGTPHDMTRRTGDLESGACVYCHVPHKAQGERLWASSPSGPQSGWGSRPIAQLCYTCHDALGGGYAAKNAVNTAFSPLAHGFSVAWLPLAPDGALERLPELPYVATGLLDCTTCHDAHTKTPPFLRREGIDAICVGCHGRENPGLVAAQNRFGTPERQYSLHPAPVDFKDNPANGATRLHELPELFQVATASGTWRLGGHRVGWQAGAGKIGCQTCHPVHGGWDYLLGVLPGPPASSLTPIENTGTAASALCQSCHQGGDAGETVGEGTDHPLNRNDGSPVTNYPAGWPSGPLKETNCSSCHDMHGGLPGTSLLRQGGDTANGWCFSCHTVSALMPSYHHSSLENDDPAIFTSVLTCGSCHGRRAGWTAHSGFEGFKVPEAPNRSALCELCHAPGDPIALTPGRYTAETGLPIAFAGAKYPADHGPRPGTASHIVDRPDEDRIGNCAIKVTAWESSGGFSKYGSGGEVICESCHRLRGNAGVLLGTDEFARLTGGWKLNLLLEPYEDNSPGVGIELPDYLPGPTLSALCRGCHRSTSENVPPSFVHNPPAHTVVGYTYPAGLTPFGRVTASILTTPIDSGSPACLESSTADQTLPPSGIGSAAPGAFSYPAANVLDCDSCHRPHGAHDSSTVEGKQLLLEYTTVGNHGTSPCLECHNPSTQCGFQPPAAP